MGRDSTINRDKALMHVRTWMGPGNTAVTGAGHQRAHSGDSVHMECPEQADALTKGRLAVAWGWECALGRGKGWLTGVLSSLRC